jgi:hypothetical protein
MTGGSRGLRYARFLGLSTGVVAVAIAVGIVPTRRLAGDESVPGMVAGCAISLVAAAMAGGLLVAAGGATPEARMQRAFLAMIVRLAVVVVLGAAGVASGEVARAPFLLWLAFTYMALLPLEVMLAVGT